MLIKKEKPAKLVSIAVMEILSRGGTELNIRQS